MKVLNFGSMNADSVFQVSHFVQPGETLSTLSQSIVAGGKGLNQSISLSRAGVPVCHAGCVGRGGEFLVRLLQENGVDTSLIRPVDELQGSTAIQVVPSGENSILLFAGSNHCITKAQMEETLALFSAGDWLILQNELNDLALLVDLAFAKGMKIVLNASPISDSLFDVDFGKIHWMLINELEAQQITGCADPDEAWWQLHEAYPQLSVLITLGSAGSQAMRVEEGAMEIARQAAFPVQAVDTTGAGDTFTGYFIAGLLEGLPLAMCMRRASMASALSVTHLGAAESIPTKKEVEDALR